MPTKYAQLPIAGGSLCCVPDSSALLTPFVLREQGDWFEDEIAFVRTLVRPGDRVIDIGANYGTYTLSMARIVGEGGVVHAFEPASDPAGMLRRSLKLNALPWVVLHELGLSDHQGDAELAVSANPELNSLTAGAVPDEGSEDIELSTLDAELGDDPGPFAFIKMDAEGEEERILGGSGRFLARHDPVIMFELKHGATVNEGLCEAFMRRGFLIYRLVPAVGALVPIPLGEPLDGYLLNAFAVRPSAEAELIRRGLLVPLRTAMPPEIGQLRVADCIARLQASPWIAAAAPDWKVDAAVPGWEDHRRAVALAEQSRAPELDSAGRVACLREAHRCIRKALVGGTTGSRLFTVARIAFDLGWRGEAVGQLQKIVGLVMDGQDPAPAFKEPFLLPLPEHERLRDLPLRELVSLAALEAYAWRSSFSAYFTGDSIRPLLERAKALPQHGARVERTLELLEARRAQGVVNLTMR